MERLVYQPDCGCQVYRIMHSKPNLYRIQYCPKHNSAPDLYEACVDLMDMQGINDGRVTVRGSPSEESILKAQKAICKAEGK